jgi:hypothetical protein
MSLGVGVGILLGRSKGQGAVIHSELIGATLMQLVTALTRGSLSYVLTIDGAEVGSWWMYQAPDAYRALAHWQAYLAHGGTVAAWREAQP